MKRLINNLQRLIKYRKLYKSLYNHVMGTIMTKVKRSEYILISRIVCRTLFRANCFGKGSMYLDNLVKGLSDREFIRLNITRNKVEIVLDALVKQKICGKKKKKHGWKYFLNMERYDKIGEIVKECGKKSIIPILLMLS